MVYVLISPARTETAPCFLGTAPVRAAGRQVWETSGGGGWALRAASHSLSDLLTPLGLRPLALPTLVNKVAPFKAASQ